MRVILKPNALINNVIGSQEFKECDYRKSLYQIYFRIEDNYLLVNTLTDSIILLDSNEFKQFCENTFTNLELFNYLISNWFLIPIDFDEYIFLKQIENSISAIHASTCDKSINSFTIFTTTHCNARCFYCFEEGRTKLNMTTETANQVVEYINKSHGDKTVKLRWFGGEPLCNEKIIDIISSGLKQKNIPYESVITSNSFLFSGSNIKKAKQLWNLKTVNTTLDGTEDVYNDCKNYINCRASAFRIVINNIRELLENGIQVIVRLNIDEHNSNDLFALVEQLYREFSSYKKFSVYPHVLFHYENGVYYDVANDDVVNKCIELQENLFKRGILSISKHYNLARYGHCMADSINSVTILPDGKLGKCEYFSDSDTWGELSSEKVNKSYIDKYNILPYYERCEKCFFRPICSHIKNCPNVSEKRCMQLEKFKIETIKYWAFTLYSRYMEKQRNTGEGSLC